MAQRAATGDENRGRGMLQAGRAERPRSVLHRCREPAGQSDSGRPEVPPVVAPARGARVPDSLEPGRPARRPHREVAMEVIYPRCCGLDVHKQTVVACLVTPGPNGIPCKEVRTSSTMAEDLAALAARLGEAGCTHAALESTGVYWHPVWDALEERIALLPVN